VRLLARKIWFWFDMFNISQLLEYMLRLLTLKFNVHYIGPFVSLGVGSFFLLFFNYCCTGNTLWHRTFYKMSDFNSPPLSFSFNPVLSFLKYFLQVSFSIYIHVYTVFSLYSPYYTLSLYPSSSHWYQLPGQKLFCLPLLQFCKKNGIFVCLR
jgi:hypothetical protein